jgi:hypothetical protein
LFACVLVFCGSGILPRSSWLEATPTKKYRIILALRKKSEFSATKGWRQ